MKAHFLNSLLGSGLTEGRVCIISWQYLLYCFDGKAVSQRNDHF